MRLDVLEELDANRDVNKPIFSERMFTNLADIASKNQDQYCELNKNVSLMLARIKYAITEFEDSQEMSRL